MLEARGIKQVLALDIILLPSPIIGRYYYLYMVINVWIRRILGVKYMESNAVKICTRLRLQRILGAIILLIMK